MKQKLAILSILLIVASLAFSACNSSWQHRQDRSQTGNPSPTTVKSNPAIDQEADSLEQTLDGLENDNSVDTIPEISSTKSSQPGDELSQMLATIETSQ